MLYVKCVEITKIEINVCYSKNMLNSQIKGTQFVSLANFANNSYIFLRFKTSMQKSEENELDLISREHKIPFTTVY